MRNLSSVVVIIAPQLRNATYVKSSLKFAEWESWQIRVWPESLSRWRDDSMYSAARWGPANSDVSGLLPSSRFDSVTVLQGLTADVEGIFVRKQFKMALAIVLAVGGMVGVAAPAAAAQDGNPGPWEMPDVRGEILQRAINSVLDVTGDVDLDLELRNRKNAQEVINYTNWEVCAQSPRGGQNINKKSMRVILVVRRPMTRGC